MGYGKTDLTQSLSVLLTDTATIMNNTRCASLTSSPKPATLMCIGGENEAGMRQIDKRSYLNVLLLNINSYFIAFS